MKRTLPLLLVAVMVTICSSRASADDHVTRNASVLPRKAIQFINKNFSSQVQLVEIDKDGSRVDSYEVRLANGTEIDFDRQGRWKKIDASRNSRIPDKLIPRAIATYINRHHQTAKIVGIERNSRGYEVELDNGIDIKFNSAGRFVRYDD